MLQQRVSALPPTAGRLAEGRIVSGNSRHLRAVFLAHHDEATICRRRENQICEIETFVADLDRFNRFFAGLPNSGSLRDRRIQAMLGDAVSNPHSK